ncbi:translation initiation factor eIF3 subunit [Calocera cornea HHB12733]|uniref:Eukaryotic translation initiation factor 3 subunit J n=1 Tax=Calocera cornea HHB12733 TaxID=1353952 RepID=A0A165D0P6_9BASI|nr:translation initiation factor eIF3 subunit [Calocera cornea HHB12733]
MSDEWDASENENEAPAPKAPVVHKKTRWDEEEEEVNIADDWDASEEEGEPAPAPAPVAPPKKKGTLKQKIAEKEAAKAARAAAGLDSDADEEEIDEVEKRRLARERELDADLKNAADLLGGPSAVNGRAAAAAAVPPELEEILKADPKTKEDFQRFSTLIYERLIKPQESKPLFATFVELHVRELAQTLRDVDVRRAATALTTLANEKIKEKSQTGKKKKAAAKPILGAAKTVNKIDTSIYEEALDDFGKETDDFM